MTKEEFEKFKKRSDDFFGMSKLEIWKDALNAGWLARQPEIDQLREVGIRQHQKIDALKVEVADYKETFKTLSQHRNCTHGKRSKQVSR